MIKRFLIVLGVALIFLTGCSDSERLHQPVAVGTASDKQVMSEEINKTTRMLPKYESLYKGNKDMIGYIKISKNHEYPILQRLKNQNYYVDKDFYCKKSVAGSIFANAHCKLGHSGICLIYGHNMKNGTMFGSLDDWKNKEYFGRHRTMQIDTLYSENKYKVVATAVINMNDSFKYYRYVGGISKTDFNRWKTGFAPYIICGSISGLKYEDVIVELSTCSYERDDNRLVLILKRKQ